MLHRRIILIGGPTASGKSARAMQMARQCRGSIINADAMQVYAGLPVLTAQPSPADRAEIPHLLYETTDAGEASSVGKWLARARAAINEVIAAGRTPILVGGTGLYFEALRGGLADIPDIPPDIRARAESLYIEWGEEKFRVELGKRDAESAARIARNDRQRLIRAFEVIEHTGKSLGEWHKNLPLQTPPPPTLAREGQGSSDVATALIFEPHLILPPRDQLYATCDQRFLSMIDNGAIDEVKNLLARNLSPALPAMKILGVREIAAWLRGESTRDTAIAKAQQMTRNYAKRQMTWFRNRWKMQFAN